MKRKTQTNLYAGAVVAEAEVRCVATQDFEIETPETIFNFRQFIGGQHFEGAGQYSLTVRGNLRQSWWDQAKNKAEATENLVEEILSKLKSKRSGELKLAKKYEDDLPGFDADRFMAWFGESTLEVDSEGTEKLAKANLGVRL